MSNQYNEQLVSRNEPELRDLTAEKNAACIPSLRPAIRLVRTDDRGQHVVGLTKVESLIRCFPRSHISAMT